ncbi:MAG: hypothetical protein AAGF57_10195, partial [Pseudomonadota bacterium]
MRLIRSGVNIAVLFSALVMTPVLLLTHFNLAIASMFGDVVERYLPHPTLLQAQQKRTARVQAQMREQRALAIQRRSNNRSVARASNEVVSQTGRRVLQRGTAAMAVGWIPALGVTADVASLSADYADLCVLFATVDKLSALLYLPESRLYSDH